MRKHLITGKFYQSPGLLAIIFFLIFLIFGLFLVDDYGIYWDDHAQYNHGKLNVAYIQATLGIAPADSSLADIQLATYKDRTHGVLFQVMAMSLQQLLGIQDARDCFLLRHYLTFLIFFTGLVFFYKLIKTQFDNEWLALLGVIMMIASPRIFADSFYNSKDIVFLSLTIINSWTLVRFLQKPNLASVMCHAMAGAFLIATRIIGLFMPAVSLLFIVLKIFGSKKGLNSGGPSLNNEPPTRLIWTTGLYLITLLFLTIGLWPYLWHDPIRRLMEIFSSMSHFNWDDPVLFRGRFLIPGNLPFYYIPFWIVITTPVLYSILFLVGLIGFIYNRSKSSALIVNIAVALFFFPLLAVIVLGSVVYDGWRQMFFLYVPFMILAISGIDTLNNFLRRLATPGLRRVLKGLVFAAIILSLSHTAFFMQRNHPHQNVYFNCLAGSETTKNFEADYWGLSYRQVLEQLLDKYPGDTLNVVSVNWPGQANADILARALRSRLRFTTYENADYYLSNYRFPIEHGKFFRHEYPYDHPEIEIEVNGNKIAGAYRLMH